MRSLVQAQSLRGYRELVRDLGGNPNRLLRLAGIDPADLNRLTAFIDFAAQMDLLERSATELRCPDFGIRLAERQDIGILGTLAVAMRYSATIGDAMRCVSKYLEVYNTALAFAITTGGRNGEARLEFRLLRDRYSLGAQTAEHGIRLTWRIMTLLSEARCDLRRVWFPHRAIGTAAMYQTHFAAPIVFRADYGALAIAQNNLNMAISENIEELHDAATRYLDAQVSRRSTALALRVRQAIAALLGTGKCSRGEVASVLMMHPRTMQRGLGEEGTTFEAIKEEVRRDLATQYLSQPELSMSQIAVLLGYSEQSAFGRSCRKWFDRSPREMRARLLADSDETTSSS